ncbi:MAG: family 78 glycoside hydrolase catalytic domain [Clostridiales bacterium]|nr:family 78 glycoside hydrolase catalytic domain [Clostridiales bacterium]
MKENNTIFNLSDAKWIGSPKPATNTSALDNYNISFNFELTRGNKAGLVTAARNKDNYVLFEIDLDKRLLSSYEYSDNAWHGNNEMGNAPSVNPLGFPKGYEIPEDAIAFGKEYEQHHFQIHVNKREVTVFINDHIIINYEADFLPQNPGNHPRKAFLMSMGFKQCNSKAIYRNLCVKSCKEDNVTVYQETDFSDDSSVLSILGEVSDGSLIVENRFELVCPVPSLNVKKDLYIDKPIKSANLLASARGFYNAYINGEKVGEDFFNPGFTDYRLRIQYQTFDVTSMFRNGSNVVGATVGKGYYSGYCGYSGALNYGEESSFIAKIIIEYIDGTTETVLTDESWKFTDKGPVNDSDYLNGEYYDARLELDWFSNNIWTDCKNKPDPIAPIPTNGKFLEEVPFHLSEQIGETAKVERVLPSLSYIENPKGHYVYDFGQNLVGTIRLKVKGKRGMSLKIRYGEMCYQNGEIYIQNLRNAANTDTYTLKGVQDGEIFIPSFTSHGFRYVEITGNGFLLEDAECIVNIEALVLCNISEKTGDFACSNELLNKLQSNIEWGQIGNYLLVPTDCPQRNERMGWTGDAQVFAGTASYNRDVKEFTKKWLVDLMDSQLMYNRQGAVPDTAPLGGDNRPAGCAGWGDAAVIVPWEMYVSYGDIDFLRDSYDMMSQWIGYQGLDSRQNRGMRTINGTEVPECSDLANISFIQVQQSRGDHLSFDESTPFILSATAYAAYVAKIMIKVADILGKPEDSRKFMERYQNIKRAFNEAWVKEDGSIGYWGEMSKSTKDTNGNVINQTYYSNQAASTTIPSQTAYALAIDFDLIPIEKLGRAGECLKQAIDEREGHLSVGFLGISHLCPALSKCGMNEIAFQLLEETSHPSWLYSVINGATTIWERWNSYIVETDSFGDVSMNSFNHYAYGAIGEWMYKNILGIRSDTRKGYTGYKHILLTPTIGGSLKYAKGWHKSPYGLIKSSWCIDGEKVLYECTIPEGTTATLTLPSSNKKILYLEGGSHRFDIDL